MQVVGNKQVLTNFIRKQRALQKGSELPIRGALLVLGGGVAGANGAGNLKALAEVAPDAADVVAGVSVGSALVYALLAGAARITPQVFNSLPWNKFIKGRPWNRKMEIDQVIKTMRALRADNRVRDHRSDLVVYATEYSTGNSLAIEAKKALDVVEAVQASMMFPGLCSGVVRLDGREVVDGACGMPFPVRHIVKKYRPTDLLIIFNQPLPEHMGWLEWHAFPWLARAYLFLHGVPRPVRNSTATMDRVMAYEMNMLTRRKAATWQDFVRGFFFKSKREPPRERKMIRWCIVAPEPHEAISPLCTDRNLVRGASERAYQFMKQLLAQCAPSDV